MAGRDENKVLRFLQDETSQANDATSEFSPHSQDSDSLAQDWERR